MTPQMATSRLPNEGEIFDRKYRIGGLLGIGSVAAVVAAERLDFDDFVAIKILRPDCCDDPAVVKRFDQAGKTAAKMQGEHAVHVLDAGAVAGRAYLVMEYLDGRDLETLLREGLALPFATAVDLLLQACEAIGEAHALGVSHHSLNPASLFLTHRANGSICVKVLDFGISGSPPLHHAAESLRYLSPEQMTLPTNADHRADIWSLGAILYELLTGHPAFAGTTTAEVRKHVIHEMPVPFARLWSGVPKEIERIVFRCLEKGPSRRYANVAELAGALAPFGTSGGTTSAESIARVVEGGIEGRPLFGIGKGTIHPHRPHARTTIPQRPPRKVPWRIVRSTALVVALGVFGGMVAHGVQIRLAKPVAIAAVPPTPLASRSPKASARNAQEPAQLISGGSRAR
jgi:eukaryotic-like serine/threonine-protein kinase